MLEDAVRQVGGEIGEDFRELQRYLCLERESA